MKTLLYNPIFINPQAYYVFPRLTRYLQPDNESTSEPANYIGTIEVKVIAYGDTTLKRTYTNTDSIDLSEFKNTWIRISLFTKVGSCVLGEWKIGNMESDLPYIDPEVLASLKAVVIVGNKTNNDADRSIVKNLVDASNPFIISNAAFKLNSGFGEYEQDFTDWEKSPKVTSFDSESIKFTSDVSWVLLYHPSSIGEDIPSFKVRIKLYGEGLLYYNYINQEGKYTAVAVKSEIFETPICYNTKYTSERKVNVGFTISVSSGECSGTITQIPSFEGAFVTDGIDDLIKSTKSATEMLDGSNEVTVVSMIHQIKTNDDTTRNNWFFTPVSYLENRVVKDKIGKTGIYGYTSTNVTNAQISDITPILGDKNDYTLYSKIEDGDRDYFTVEGFQNQGIWYVSSIAWYWTIIANKVLTTDQINQVIAYYNLDKTLKPDILCNTIKQGITNENHAEFGDKLIDFSGNGRDIQLNNIAWDGDSGIGKYNYPNWKVNVTQGNKYARIVYYDSINGTYSADFKGVTELYKSYGLSVEIRVNRANTVDFHSIKEDGIYTVTPPDDTTSIDIRFGGENVYNASCDITITQIPSHADALCLGGVNDFGKVTGMPVYKDYTVVADREIETINGGVLSKSYVADNGSFIFEQYHLEQDSTSSFGYTKLPIDNLNRDRKISYQSKYSYNGTSLSVGTGIDGSNMWLATIRDNDSRFSNIAIYSLMTFPYSMSEFLIERQLKKHKLGTLYPDMVEFRPIVKSNSEYKVVDCYIDNLPAVVGNYYPINSKLKIAVTTKGAADEVTSLTVNGVSLGTISVNGNRFTFNGTLSDKSPQKINITIDEYIRFEDIVQPYPVLLRFKDENGNEVSWGGKFRVGSTITRIGSAADSNLLPNIYNIFGLLLNGNQVTSSKVIVEKTMVFKSKSAYIFDNNEPKCILSPRLLRIPNSSYKILGHIPDISGHGNHGKINNSAYKLNSGVNGYLVDFTTLKDDGIKGIVRTDSKIYLDKSFNYNQGFWLGSTNNPSPAYKVKVSGIPETGMLTYTGGVWLNLVNGINELPARTNTEEEHGFVIQSPNLDWSNLVIEQIGEYEGAYCLDGVDDSVTIPTTVGGKQVLMKVNWDSPNASILYDQRGYNNEFAIYNGTNDSDGNPIPAYQGRNNGQTYIDGILNSNIKALELRAITHNITITNELSSGANKTYPIIGSSKSNAYFVNMALYDFMLFDNISTDDKIKELNEYVGIEGNTEWRKTK